MKNFGMDKRCDGLRVSLDVISAKSGIEKIEIERQFMKQIRNSLGIIFYEQTVAVAEVGTNAGGCRIRRCAEFNMPGGMTIENLPSQQAKFGVFLKENGFKSRHAIVGISAKQIVSTLLKIPPVQDAQTRRETIQIHLERKLELEFSDIVFDCRDQTSSSTDTLVLMTLKKNVAAIQAFLASFKITPLYLTANSLALDFQVSDGVDCHLIHYPGSVEAFIFQDRSLQAVLNIARKSHDVSDDELGDDVTRQINRALWALPSKGESPHYTVWTTHADTTVVGQQLGRTLANLKTRQIKSIDGSAAGNLCGIASQLARRAVAAEPAGINFLNGHQQTKNIVIPKQWYSRIAMVAAAVLILLGLYFYGWYADCRETAQYKENLQSMSENVEDAEQIIKRVGYARQWFAHQPVHLENLRELTLAFPRSSDIWLTSLAVDESLNQVIAGRAMSEDAILDVVDTLKSNERFKDIKLLYIRKMGKSTDVMTFAINFNCRGEQ